MTVAMLTRKNNEYMMYEYNAYIMPFCWMEVVFLWLHVWYRDTLYSTFASDMELYRPDFTGKLHSRSRATLNTLSLVTLCVWCRAKLTVSYSASLRLIKSYSARLSLHSPALALSTLHVWQWVHCATDIKYTARLTLTTLRVWYCIHCAFDIENTARLILSKLRVWY